jgi:LuxR family maltose regulon positive regulatory protein
MLSIADSLALRLDLDDTLSSYKTELSAEPEAQLAADLWELPVLTACRRAVLSGREEHLELAEKTLAACYAFALSRNNKRQLLQIFALRSLLHEVKGEKQAALDCLKKAVSLGEAGGALRYFVDLGPDFMPLLQGLHGQGFATAYIEEVFSAYGETVKQEDSKKAAGDGKAAALSPEAAAVLADLTNREMDVLLLLSERLTNKEIAKRLHLSPHTVKQYTLDIYQKFEVNGRRQAAARASELGILYHGISKT